MWSQKMISHPSLASTQPKILLKTMGVGIIFFQGGSSAFFQGVASRISSGGANSGEISF